MSTRPWTVRVTTREDLADPRAATLQRKAADWLNISIADAAVCDTYRCTMELSPGEQDRVVDELFVDPVAEEAVNRSVAADFDWVVTVGFKPGIKDNEGDRATGAVQDLVGGERHGRVYTATDYLLRGDLSRGQVEEMASELLANEMLHDVEVRPAEAFAEQADDTVPDIGTASEAAVETFPPEPDTIAAVCDRRNLALSDEEIAALCDHFQDDAVRERRAEDGLPEQVTDLELEAIAVTQSEHCKHKIFNGTIRYTDTETGETEVIDSLFDTYITRATEEIDPDWILSVFWDNAGVIEFTDDHAVTLKYETHNSPSGKEPYGGALTGIVGVYRDPMGTGRGSRIVAGSYGYCTPEPFYDGELDPDIAPERLLEGIVNGVRDGGNKSGVPTVFGYSKHHNSYLGKPLVYVGAVGLMPKEVDGDPAWEKQVESGDRIVTVGGRVGRDGIHGVTEASLEFGDHITGSHVQIGDPFTQKKVHDFLMEARDEGLFGLIWDCGGGGLASAVGETAEFADGCVLDLDAVPLKYEGLDPWEIIISESQERMLLGVPPENMDRLDELAATHDVEVSDIGEFQDSGRFRVRWEDEVIASLDLEFLHHGFPRLDLDAEWEQPEHPEPALDTAAHEEEFLEMLQRPNIASSEWIQRQYDHEVQGSSVIKPFTGRNEDVDANAAVIKPLPDEDAGLALALGNCFEYAQIDPYWMAAASLDEAIRRVLSVGASLDHIALNDNFCWPNSLYDPEDNPDGKQKLAGLVRANRALYEFTTAFGTPCISGKDSMFIDGEVPTGDGDTQKVSGIPSLQFAALGKVDDVERCINSSLKQAGDRIYVLGDTAAELGGSEYYAMHGEVGNSVPTLDADAAGRVYRAVDGLIDDGLLRSCRGCYRGGLAVTLAKKAFAGDRGLAVDLGAVPGPAADDRTLLYSESPARFVVTVAPGRQDAVEQVLEDAGVPYGRIGTVTAERTIDIAGTDGQTLLDLPVDRCRQAWQETFEPFEVA